MIENTRDAEFVILDRFGETERTIIYLDELQSVAEQATDKFSQFSIIQIRIFNIQPYVPRDMLELVMQLIGNTETRLPALEQSIQEIKTEWKLL